MSSDPKLRHLAFALTRCRQGLQAHAPTALLLFLVVTVAAGCENPALDHYNRGVVLLEEGQLDAAIVSFRKAIELNDELPKAHVDLGYALIQKGRFDEAIVTLRRAIELDDELPLAHMNLSYALTENGLLDEAIASARKAIELNDQLAVAHLNLGLAQFRKGQLDEGITSFRKAIELNDAYPEAYAILGLVLIEKGQLDEAMASLQKALKWRADLSDEQLDDIIAGLRGTLRVRPNFPEAYANLGLALMQANVIRNRPLDDAISNIRMALRLSPNFPAAHYYLGLALSQSFDLRQVQEGVSSFRKAIEVRHDFPEAYVGLGESLARLGSITDAMVAYSKAQSLDSTLAISASSWNTLCWYGSIWGYAADVMTACDQGVALAPNGVLTRDGRGIARALTGDFEGAIGDFEAYVAQTSDDQVRAQRRGWLTALRKGENPFTSELVETLRDRMPQQISCPLLEYPRVMQQANMEGNALLQFVVDTTGHVERGSVKVMASTHRLFEGPARNMVTRCLFRPGRLRGLQVRMLIQLPIYFRLTPRVRGGAAPKPTNQDTAGRYQLWSHPSFRKPLKHLVPLDERPSGKHPHQPLEQCGVFLVGEQLADERQVVGPDRRVGPGGRVAHQTAAEP